MSVGRSAARSKRRGEVNNRRPACLRASSTEGLAAHPMAGRTTRTPRNHDGSRHKPFGSTKLRLRSAADASEVLATADDARRHDFGNGEKVDVRVPKDPAIPRSWRIVRGLDPRDVRLHAPGNARAGFQAGAISQATSSRRAWARRQGGICALRQNSPGPSALPNPADETEETTGVRGHQTADILQPGRPASPHARQLQVDCRRPLLWIEVARRVRSPGGLQGLFWLSVSAVAGESRRLRCTGELWTGQTVSHSVDFVCWERELRAGVADHVTWLRPLFCCPITGVYFNFLPSPLSLHLPLCNTTAQFE